MKIKKVKNKYLDKETIQMTFYDSIIIKLTY